MFEKLCITARTYRFTIFLIMNYFLLSGIIKNYYCYTESLGFEDFRSKNAWNQSKQEITQKLWDSSTFSKKIGDEILS